MATGGVCRRANLLDLGLSRSAIDRRIRSGFLHVVERGVYLAEPCESDTTPLHLALAMFQGAVLSHETAGRINRLAVEPATSWIPTHIIVPHGSRKSIDGIVAHERRRMPPPEDLTIVDGLDVTSPARTIVDLASSTGEARLRHIVQTAIRDQTTSVDELTACFNSVARRGVNGVGRLRPILDSLVDDTTVSHSVLESAVAALLTEHDLDGFESQFRPPWFDGRRGIVDFAHPTARLILEADGRRWHGRNQDMAEDRRRDRLASLHGWISVRVTWHEVNHRPADIATEIAAIVTARLASAA